MTPFGRIEPFNAENESITAYLERIELFFQANEIANEKKVAVLLSVIGGKTYTLLRGLLSPAKPQEKTFAELAAELKKHFEPRKVVIAERFHFHRRSQEPDETIAEYMGQLRKLSIDCAFNEALRDRFVCGLRAEAIQRRLLSESNLTLTKALETAQGMEAAAKKAQQFKGTETAIQKVTRATGSSSGSACSPLWEGKPPPC